MANTSSNDLPYGHLGQAVYDPDEQFWNFQRASNDDNVFRPLGESKLVAKPAEDVARASPKATPLIASERLRKDVPNVIKRFPEVQPAAGLLAPLLRVSEAILSATARHDPLQGDLLAMGSIPSELSHRTITVAALLHGPTGSDLRLAQVQSRRRGWDDTKDAWVEVPTIHGEDAVWNGEGVPIQQICFAHAIEGSDMFLAARMPKRTLIFRPTLATRGPSAPKLAASLCFEISIARTGGVSHADVAFNPWYTRQFGIVDQAGNWSIWELEGRLTTGGRLTCQSPKGKSTSSPVRPVDDGWARVSWVCNPVTVAVCTRQQLALYNVTGSDATQAPLVTTVKTVDGSWYLGMTQIPSHTADLAVLSSTHLTLYHVKESGADAIEAKAVFQIRHYRNPEDTTLSLAAFALEDVTLIVLRSGVQPIVSVYRLQLDADGGVLVSTPVELALPKLVAEWGGFPSVASMHFADIPFGCRGQQPERSMAFQYQDRGIRFASLALLSKDLALHQGLYVSTPASARYGDMIPPTWEAKPAVKALRLRKKSFVVDDDDEVETSNGEAARRPPKSSYQQRRHSQAPDRIGQWTVSLELSARAVTDDVEPDTITMDDLLETAEGLLRNPKMAGVVPWRTLHDLAQGEIFLQDPEDSATKLDSLGFFEPQPSEVSQDDARDSQSATTLTLRPLSSQPTERLTDLCTDMARDWITPLPPTVSGQVRVAKGQLVRQAAAEVASASRLIGTRPIGSEIQPMAQESQNTWDIPVRAGPSSVQHPEASGQVASQLSVLPTPSPSATLSVTTASSHPSTFAAPEIARLSRYTTFSKHAPSVLPRSLAGVLSHWALGTEPASYDWRTISRHLAEHEIEVEEQMTEKDQARVQRRAERHLRRQRREAAVSEAAQLAGSQALEIASAGQPPHVLGVESQAAGVAGSSQSQGLGGGPASQLVPGRFGGRPPPKKKRKQGF
ncbi:hypothetical protein B0A55_06665 [Friedmanniomyces simplex]|uniref:RNA polymerase I-specific transcription initiation factor RRN6-like protein n=1 Tax=Friedmanniomyces simplex TaxID=329884 RepID=A0A4U0X6D6_9PEZI|nr:hypothetical protein B0A55_06665 [Friedmanniomyces simplex]